jgi:hypothetical protein
MTILNKNITILLLCCFCVLSINAVTNFKKKQNAEVMEISAVDVSYVKPSAQGKQDASITIVIKNNTGSYKVIAVSNTSLGTITKEGKGNTAVLNNLYAGFYKLYIIDSNNITTEYQINID